MIQDRIIELMAYLQLSARGLAESIGVQPSGVSHIISGRNKPSLEFVNKLLERYDTISYDWLVNGRGSMLKNVAPVPRDPDLFSSLEQTPPKPAASSVEKGGTASAKAASASSKPTAKRTAEKETKDAAFPHKARSANKISKVILFYEDGSFEEYTPK